MKNVLFAFVLLFSVSLLAQDFLIRNVTLFDGNAIIENTSVLVENGKILKVAPTIESTADQIDGTGKFLMPALSNSHVHAFSALALKEAAQAGVLQVFDMHGMEQYQRQMQETFSANPEYADFYFAGSAATVPGGHGTQFGFKVPTLTKPEEAKSFVENRKAAGANYIKIIVEPWKETLDRPTISALIKQAHLQDVPAVIHISKLEDAKFVLDEKADGLVHIWWDKKADTSVLNKLKATNSFFVIPTLLTSHLALNTIRELNPEGVYLTNEEISAEAKKLYDAGIPLLAGTDPPNAGINYGSDLYKEMNLMSKAGIPNLEVLKTATSNPSVYFNLNDTGFIKEGFKANMILLDKNPIDTMENISFINTVWKLGQPVTRN